MRTKELFLFEDEAVGLCMRLHRVRLVTWLRLLPGCFYDWGPCDINSPQTSCAPAIRIALGCATCRFRFMSCASLRGSMAGGSCSPRASRQPSWLPSIRSLASGEEIRLHSHDDVGARASPLPYEYGAVCISEMAHVRSCQNDAVPV